MVIARRRFLTGLLAAIAAPAIVRLENIMPVRASIVLPHDPLVPGIRWQTWPLGAVRPTEFAEGSIGPELGRGVLKPLSHFLKRVDKHRAIFPDLVWEPMPDRRVMLRDANTFRRLSGGD